MNILCIDDDRLFLGGMANRIESAGHVVDQADGYKSALRLFMDDPFKYDVVITDLDLGKSGQYDGEQLIHALIELREVRGYDPAPEFICITGADEKRDPRLKNMLQERGCQFVLKGTDQYFLEAQAALLRLQAVRSGGPPLLFRHHSSPTYQWDDKPQWDCAEGEDVEGVYFLQAGRALPIRLAPAPRRVLDFLARRAWRRAFAVEEAASSMSLSPFYSYWADDHVVTADSVKNNMRRIRVALDSFFKDKNLPYTSESIVISVRNRDKGEISLELPQFQHKRSIKARRAEEVVTPVDVFEGYKFIARSVLEHIP
jgi:CheY-like chemotaxis protein